MDKKTKRWILLFAALCVAGLLIWSALGRFGSGTVAVISVDGEEYERVDLSRVQESYTINIDTRYGHNTVLVEPGAISVSEADCPDGICVAQGAIHKGGIPIICMPHRLYIEIEGSGIDG